MCTLTFAWRVFEDPLAVAANRDELLSRPASPPQLLGESPRVLAPRDGQAGGTWIGYNDHGTFVAVTNRWTREPGDGDRSRGLLVRDALAGPTAAAAASTVRAELDERTYEPFHLLVADADSATLFEHDEVTSETALVPGLYVVGNTGWCGERGGPADAAERQRTETFFVPGHRSEAGRRQAANDRRVLDALVDAAADPGDASDWLDAAAGVLADHEYGVCVHGDGYGTRSSSLVRLGATREYRYAAGPPCETPYEPVGSL